MEGHTDKATACAFSPDGETIVSGSHDNTLRLWDARSGACRATLGGHAAWIAACTFSPDGDALVSGSVDKTLKLWDAVTGKCEKTVKEHGTAVRACAFSPDGSRLVSGGDDNTLKLWDAETGRCEATLEGHGDKVFACDFSPDGRRIVSGKPGQDPQALGHRDGPLARRPSRGTASQGQRLRLLPRRAQDRLGQRRQDPQAPRRQETGALRGDHRQHGSEIYACAVSPDGRRIVSAGGYPDKVLKVWDAGTGTCEATLEGHDDPGSALAPSPPTGAGSSR